MAKFYSGDKNRTRKPKSKKQTKTVVQSTNQVMKIEDFLNVDKEPCKKKAKLNQIVEWIEYMVNILLYPTYQPYDSINIHVIDISAMIQQPTFQKNPSWKALSEPLRQARNYVRHIPFPTITDNVFEQKVLDYNEIMEHIIILMAEADNKLKRNPELFKKLFDTHIFTVNLIKAARKLVPTEKKKTTGLFNKLAQAFTEAVNLTKETKKPLSLANKQK